jgi:hypothetical protein
MRNKLPYIASLLLAVLLFAGWTSQAPRRAAYEYKFEFDCSEKKANSLGADGWELVAIQSPGPGMGNNVPTYAFRRVK